MWQAESGEGELTTVHLQPGELLVTQEPTLIVTILGSCVAVCLYDWRRKAGAMCHGLLPRMGSDAQLRECGRFIDCAVHRMVEELTERHGCSLRDVNAKVFGGASTFAKHVRPAAAVGRVGELNVKTARCVLGQYGLPVSIEEVGGSGGYKIFFESHTGKVSCSTLRSLHSRFSSKK